MSRRASKRLITGAIAGLLLAASACGGPAPDAVPGIAEPVDLLEQLSRAEVRAETPQHVLITTLPVAGEARTAIFMHPPSRATFPSVRLTLSSRLDLSFGVSELAWGEAGDGVEFVVYARPRGRDEVRIFSSYLDPKHVEHDRRWADAVVTLGTYAGQEVSITLETAPGPEGNIAWDWAGWSRATLSRGEG